MEEDRKLSTREREIINRYQSPQNAERRDEKNITKEKKEETPDQPRARLDGKVGKFEDEHTRPTGRSGGIAGA